MPDVYRSLYSLWGMMDGAANFCWEVAAYDPSYMEAHQDWLARNVFVRDEIDAALAASGEAATLGAEGEAYGSNGILEILKVAENPEEACINWQRNARDGTYDIERFMAEQLGRLRERDGL